MLGKEVGLTQGGVDFQFSSELSSLKIAILCVSFELQCTCEFCPIFVMKNLNSLWSDLQELTIKLVICKLVYLVE